MRQTGNRIMLISGNLPIHKTRFTELGFWNVPSSPGKGPGFWQCVDLTGDRPAQVGYQYATKAELLANLEAYATEYGCENASPKPTAITQDMKDRLDGLRCAIATCKGPADDEDLPSRIEKELYDWQVEAGATLLTS
jgi:hypothetical protein